MATEIFVTTEFENWWDGLTTAEQASIEPVVEMLIDQGVLVPFPYSSAIVDSPKLRELRVQHAGKPFRVLYAFDPKRNAVLLLGGNKTGGNRWYERQVPQAEKLFAKYLEDTRPVQ